MSVPRSRLLTFSEILVFGGILFALIAPLFSSESDSPSSPSSQIESPVTLYLPSAVETTARGNIDSQ